MRKTFLYLLLLVVLGFGVYYFLFNPKEDIFSVDEAGFTIKDTAAIGKIFIAGPDGKSVTVTRTDSGWMLNEKYRALRSAVNIVLKTVAKQRAEYPVPESMHNTVVSVLAGRKVTVELYNRRGKLMRRFFVAGETKDVDGSYMLIDGAQRPYVVKVPGFEGYLTPNYPYDFAHWRDRTVFDLEPDQVKAVSVTYPEYPLNSFVIRQQEGKVLVEGDPSITGNKQKFNERRARVFLKFFENMNLEGYLKTGTGMDTMLQVMPKYCELDVTGYQGQHQHVDIYWSPLTKRSKNLTTPDPDIPDNKYDADRYYAVINDFRDTAVIQSSVFNKVFRKAYEFYEPDVQMEQPKDPRKGQINYSSAAGPGK